MSRGNSTTWPRIYSSLHCLKPTVSETSKYWPRQLRLGMSSIGRVHHCVFYLDSPITFSRSACEVRRLWDWSDRVSIETQMLAWVWRWQWDRRTISSPMEKFTVHWRSHVVWFRNYSISGITINPAGTIYTFRQLAKREPAAQPHSQPTTSSARPISAVLFPPSRVCFITRNSEVRPGRSSGASRRDKTQNLWNDSRVSIEVFDKQRLTRLQNSISLHL